MPHPKRQVECICEQCGKIFSVKASQAKNRRFCDWNCRVKSSKNTKEEITCQNCGTVFTDYKSYRRKYCSISCQMSARNRTDANPSYHRDVSGKNNPMYGKGYLIQGENNGMHGRTGEQNPAWKGGRKVRADGYVLIYAPDHPHAISDRDGRNTYVLEHRLVMEQHLGRYLTEDEVVHHIDKNPSNNAIENLQLFSSHSKHILKAHQDVWWVDVSPIGPSD